MISFDNLSPFKQSQSSWFYLEKVSKFHLHFDSCIPVIVYFQNGTDWIKIIVHLSNLVYFVSTYSDPVPGLVEYNVNADFWCFCCRM